MRFSTPYPPPLRLAQAAMPGHRRHAEAPFEPLEERLSEGDFGKEDENLAVQPQRLCNGLEIDFGLAGPGNAIEQERLKVPCPNRSEEHTSELQSLMRISYAVFCLKK